MSVFSCKDCKERHLGCHSTCEKYIAEKAESERVRQLKMQESLNSDVAFLKRKRKR